MMEYLSDFFRKMNRLFTIDPGYDYEIQELEEFTNQKPVYNACWSNAVRPSRIIVASPGLSTQILATIRMELVSTLIFDETDKKLNKPGINKGVGLYQAQNFHVLLTSKTIALERINIVASMVVELGGVIEVLDIAPGLPNSPTGVTIYPSPGFKTLTGLSAAVLTKVLLIN